MFNRNIRAESFLVLLSVIWLKYSIDQVPLTCRHELPNSIRWKWFRRADVSRLIKRPLVWDLFGSHFCWREWIKCCSFWLLIIYLPTFIAKYYTMEWDVKFRTNIHGMLIGLKLRGICLFWPSQVTEAFLSSLTAHVEMRRRYCPTRRCSDSGLPEDRQMWETLASAQIWTSAWGSSEPLPQLPTTKVCNSPKDWYLLTSGPTSLSWAPWCNLSSLSSGLL